MKRRFAASGRAVGVFLAVAVCGLPLLFGSRASAAPGRAKAVKIGTQAINADFRDLDGMRHTVKQANSLPAVYLFLSTTCPVGNAYTPRIQALVKTYRERGVHFVGVYPSHLENEKQIARHAQERKYDFPLVKDDGTLASVLGATTIPEVVVVDKSGTLRYRGRIDDNKDAAKVASRDLKSALDAVLSGKSIARAETSAFGCNIVTGLPRSSAKLAKVTYTRDVAPILQKNCQVCHRAGEVAPFGLENYKEAATFAKLIKTYTANRKMPPWKADSSGEFHDERRLTQAEIKTIAAWVDAGAPEGNPKDLPMPPKFGSGWQNGQPDQIVEMPVDYDVPAEGNDIYRCFVVPNENKEDRWVSTVEVMPGNRAVVHHVLIYLDKGGNARKLDAADPGPGYTNPTPGNFPGFLPVGGLGGWAPGNQPFVLPPGIGMFLPKDTDIVIEVHYHMNGKPEKDRTKFGIHYSKVPVEKRIRSLVGVDTTFQIPAGNPDYVVKTKQLADLSSFKFGKTVQDDITVRGITPHMHLIGRKMKVTAIFPDKTEKVLVNVPDWDFNWQITYNFKAPVRLPKGTEILVEARYDNSANNPNNPNKPPKLVGYGEQSTNEMCVAFLSYTLDSEQLYEKVTNAGAETTAPKANDRR